MTSDRPEFLLVHGAWHGAWCWDALRTVLTARGWRTRAVDLPSAVPVGSRGRLPGMLDDARVVRAAIDAIDGPVVVVGHSYGGVPVTQATADAPNVVHLVYVTAFQLDIGESVRSFDPELVDGAIDPASVEDAMPVPDNAAAMLYADVPAAARQQALARLVPQSARSFADPVTRAGWHTIPSSFVVCDNDQGMPPSTQERLAGRAGAVHHLPSGHSPFLARPGELATVLTAIAAGRA